MAAPDRLRDLPPDDLHVAELPAFQPAARHRSALEQDVFLVVVGPETRVPVVSRVRWLLLRGLRVVEIDEPVAREVRIDLDVEQAALAAIRHRRHAADRLRQPPAGIDAQAARLLGDEQSAVGQEGHAPWLAQRGETFDRDGAGFRLHDFASGAGPLWGPHGRREDEGAHHGRAQRAFEQGHRFLLPFKLG